MPALKQIPRNKYSGVSVASDTVTVSRYTGVSMADRKPVDTPEPLFDLPPTDPKLIADRAGKILRLSQLTGISPALVERNYQAMSGNLEHLETTFRESQKTTISEWKPGTWERISRYFYTPPPPGGFDRSDRPLRTIAKLGAVGAAETLSGLGLTVPDILAKHFTGENTLGEAVAEALGVELTPEEKRNASLPKFVASLTTAGALTGPVIAKLPARAAFRYILGGTAQFATRQAAAEAVERITQDEPIDWAEINKQGLWGALFGGVSATGARIGRWRRFRAFIKARPEFSDPKKFPPKLIKRMFEAGDAWQGGMSQKAVNTTYGKEIREFEKLFQEHFSQGVVAQPPAVKTKTGFPQETKNMMQRYNDGIRAAQGRGDYEAVEAMKVMEHLELTNLEKRAQAEAGKKPELPGKAPEAPVTPEEVEGALPPVTDEYVKGLIDATRTTDKVIDIGAVRQEIDAGIQEVMTNPPVPRSSYDSFQRQARAILRKFIHDPAELNARVQEAIDSAYPAVRKRLEGKGRDKMILFAREKAARNNEPMGSAITFGSMFSVRDAMEEMGIGLEISKGIKGAKNVVKVTGLPEDIEGRPIEFPTDELGPDAQAMIKEMTPSEASKAGRPRAQEAIDPLTGKPLSGPQADKRIGLAPSERPGAKKKKPSKGFVNVEPVLKAHETFIKILEPSKAAERKVGKEAVAAVIKGVHNPDVAQIEFTEAQLTGHDKTIGQMRDWFAQFKDADLKNLMMSRGNPVGDKARLIQKQAMEDLPDELKDNPRAINAIQQIADFNYAKLQSVVGDDVNKVKDYFYGIYEEPDKVDAFIKHWKTTKRFLKEKKLPTVADAAAYGLKLRHANPVDNLKAEYMGIARLEGMTWMRDELLRTGKGIFIDELAEAPLTMSGAVEDPVFAGYRMDPDLANLINNLIAKNKITMQPQLNALRQANNFIRTVKFMGSAFHLLSVAKQSVADSGYLGFLYKKTAYRGLTTGFRQNDPIFKTEVYKDYVKHGGGHRYSIESEAERTFNNAVNELNAVVGKGFKAGMLPVKIPAKFVEWMFQSYIPKVKYSKYLDVVAEQSKKLGRPLKASEKTDIIKEQQNFYGMMNERLFGRSGTVTSALRFWFMSPGYAEGNYRTMLKAATQWGQKQEAELLKGLPGAEAPGFRASRSRSNIINSLIISGTIATVTTMIMTGKPPKKPETLDDLRDVFKIDTGQKDERGQRIMIDMLTYDKDYWNVALNTMRLRPDKALEESWKRIGGMKAPTAKMISDLALMAAGEAIYDWKGNRVIEITDPFLRKAMKLIAHEVKELEPISVSVFRQARRKDIDTVTAAIGTLMGVRPTKSEKDKRDQQVLSKIYSLKGQQEELYLYLGRIKNPREAVERYNKTVQGVLNYKHVSPALKLEWEEKLTVDVDRLLENKAASLGSITLDDKDRDRAIKYLKNFGVTQREFEKLLEAHAARPKKKSTLGPAERRLEGHPVLGPSRRTKRATERFKEGSK